MKSLYLQQISFIEDMKAIVRQSYLDKIAKYLGKDTIIIIVGQRRMGKSYTLRLFRDKVAEDAHANIIFIDKEKHEFADIRTSSLTRRNMSLPTFGLTET